MLVGDKHGSSSIPTEIPEDEFETLVQLLHKHNTGTSILKRLYIKVS